MSRARLLGSACLLAAVIAGCGDDRPPAGEPTEVGGLAVSDAWARPTPTGVDESAFYVTLENRGAAPDRLIGAASDRCTVLTPHLSEIVDGVASMAEATGERLRLSPGDRIEMEPLGLHLMCMGLDSPLRVGDRVSVELRFAEHDPIGVELVVDQR